MGFSAPKPDPTVVAQQQAAAAQAKQQKVSLLQAQLSDEDMLRQQIYGRRSAPLANSTQPGLNALSLFFGAPQ